jgi:hypothetical protein
MQPTRKLTEIRCGNGRRILGLMFSMFTSPSGDGMNKHLDTLEINLASQEVPFLSILNVVPNLNPCHLPDTSFSPWFWGVCRGFQFFSRGVPEFFSHDPIPRHFRLREGRLGRRLDEAWYIVFKTAEVLCVFYYNIYIHIYIYIYIYSCVYIFVWLCIYWSIYSCIFIDLSIYLFI